MGGERPLTTAVIADHSTVILSPGKRRSSCRDTLTCIVAAVPGYHGDKTMHKKGPKGHTTAPDLRRVCPSERTAPTAAEAAPATSTTTFAEGIERLTAYLQLERSCSRTTIKTYRSGVRRFARFLSERYGCEPPLEQVTAEDIRTYHYALAGRKLRPATLRGALHALRALFALLLERGVRADNPALSVKLPKLDTPERTPVTDEEVEQLLRGCDREPRESRRLMARAIIALLGFGAVRRQELLDLAVDDIDLTDGRITIRKGKGGKRRSFFLAPSAVQIVREWVAIRPRAAHSYLLVADRSRRLGHDGLRRLLRDVASYAGLRDRDHIKPHAFRHGGATRLQRNGADLASVKAVLGHNRIETTARYVHTDDEQLRRVAEMGELHGGTRRRPSPRARVRHVPLRCDAPVDDTTAASGRRRGR
jgi:site-specific recombinase XerD